MNEWKKNVIVSCSSGYCCKQCSCSIFGLSGWKDGVLFTEMRRPAGAVCMGMKEKDGERRSGVGSGCLIATWKCLGGNSVFKSGIQAHILIQG